MVLKNHTYRLNGRATKWNEVWCSSDFLKAAQCYCRGMSGQISGLFHNAENINLLPNYFHLKNTYIFVIYVRAENILRDKTLVYLG